MERIIYGNHPWKKKRSLVNCADVGWISQRRHRTGFKTGCIKAAPTFYNGQAQIVPAFQDKTKWIKQELWVETEFDSDGDGKRDRMHVDVTRPQQTATEGLKLATIYAFRPLCRHDEESKCGM